MFTGAHRCIPRLTVSLDDDQDDWLEAEADRRDRSKAHVMRHLIDAHRTGEVSADAHHSGADVDDLRDRLATLEERVADLERRDDVDAEPQAPSTPSPEYTREATPEVADTTHSGEEKPRSAPSDAETSDAVGERFTPPPVALEFDKQLTDRRVEVIEEWLEHVRQDGRVQKSDFEAWYTDDHADRTGYEPGGFWDFFAKPAMRQVEGAEQPNSRTYRWVGADE